MLLVESEPFPEIFTSRLALQHAGSSITDKFRLFSMVDDALTSPVAIDASPLFWEALLSPVFASILTSLFTSAVLVCSTVFVFEELILTLFVEPSPFPDTIISSALASGKLVYVKNIKDKSPNIIFLIINFRVPPRGFYPAGQFKFLRQIYFLNGFFL